MNNQINNCLFCKIINNEINACKIYENEYVLAFLDINPSSLGHTLVIPKKCFSDLSSCEDKYLEEMIKAEKHIANYLYKKLNCLGFNYLSNEKEIAGQVIFHLHFHIIPKYSKTEGFIIKKHQSPITTEEIKNIHKKIGMIK